MGVSKGTNGLPTGRSRRPQLTEHGIAYGAGNPRRAVKRVEPPDQTSGAVGHEQVARRSMSTPRGSVKPEETTLTVPIVGSIL